jgi:hypothetical protein
LDLGSHLGQRSASFAYPGVHFAGSAVQGAASLYRPVARIPAGEHP